jgi:hypothetical protein
MALCKLMRQFETLRNNQDYDAVLLLTDEGSYELASERSKLPAITSPLWMVHLGGQLPRAYKDATLQAIQNSNGGVATDLPTVIKRLTTEQAEVKSVVDGYSWTSAKSDLNRIYLENRSFSSSGSRCFFTQRRSLIKRGSALI